MPVVFTCLCIQAVAACIDERVPLNCVEVYVIWALTTVLIRCNYCVWKLSLRPFSHHARPSYLHVYQ